MRRIHGNLLQQNITGISVEYIETVACSNLVHLEQFLLLVLLHRQRKVGQLDEPTLPFADISNISARLKTFLIENEALKPIPNCWIVEVKASKSKPNEYFLRDVNNTVAIKWVPVESFGSST